MCSCILHCACTCDSCLQVEHTASILTSDANPLTSEGVASATLVTDHPAVELTQASEEELGGGTEETVYTSAISEFEEYVVGAYWRGDVDL